MGYSLFLGSEIYDAKGNSFGTIERFVRQTGEVVLEVKLSKKHDEITQVKIPLTECVIKGQSISTKKSVKSIISAEKKKKKDEIKKEKERLMKILEKRRRLSEPEEKKEGPTVPAGEEKKKSHKTPADWIICPNCEHALSEPYKFCPYCSEPLPYCPKCGKPVKKDFVACPWCGTKL